MSNSSSKSTPLVHPPLQELQADEHWIPAFRHPHLPLHPVVQRQNMLFKIFSGATGSFVVIGKRDPSSILVQPHCSGCKLLSSHCWICKYTLNECCSAAPLVGGNEERSALILVDDLKKNNVCSNLFQWHWCCKQQVISPHWLVRYSI